MWQLNLGCGDSALANWLNYDLRSLEGVDIVGDIRSLPFKDNSFSKILAMDVVEHNTRFELPNVLYEIWRVLAKGGKAIIKMPNLDTIVKRYVNGEIDIKEFVRLVYGGAEYPENIHKVGANPFFIKHLLLETGITKIKINPVLPVPDMNNMMVTIKK